LVDGVYDELGSVELDVVGALFRDDQLAVLREAREAASNSSTCSLVRFACPLVKPGNSRAPALRTISGLSSSDGAASVAVAMLFCTEAASSATA
jgi:hypothetical protein